MTEIEDIINRDNPGDTYGQVYTRSDLPMVIIRKLSVDLERWTAAYYKAQKEAEREQ